MSAIGIDTHKAAPAAYGVDEHDAVMAEFSGAVAPMARIRVESSARYRAWAARYLVGSGCRSGKCRRSVAP